MAYLTPRKAGDMKVSLTEPYLGFSLARYKFKLHEIHFREIIKKNPQKISQFNICSTFYKTAQHNSYILYVQSVTVAIFKSLYWDSTKNNFVSPMQAVQLASLFLIPESSSEQWCPRSFPLRSTKDEIWRTKCLNPDSNPQIYAGMRCRKNKSQPAGLCFFPSERASGDSWGILGIYN